MALSTPLRVRRNRGIASTTTAASIVVNAGITAVRLSATGVCWVAITADGATAPIVGDTSKGFLVAASWPEVFGVNPGDTISCISSGAQTLSVAELSL